MATQRSPTQQFETLDIMSAAWLVMHGHNPGFRKDGSKVLLIFDGTNKLYQDLTSYTRGAQCNANQFAQTFKALSAMAEGLVLAFKTTLVGLLAYLPLRKAADYLLQRLATQEDVWTRAREGGA